MRVIRKINWKNYFEKAWPFLLIIMATYLLASIQINNRGMVLDIDTMFHYNRFNDIAEQIRTGKFSYFQTNYGFEQSGRIINAMYGPFFAYFNGLLVLIFGSWYKYQIASYFVLGITAGSGMYLLARKCDANKIISTLVAIFYINIGGVQSWFDHSNLMAWGAAFAPFVLIEAVNMIQDTQRPIRWIRLALIMSIVGQTHLLSTILFAIALVPFAIIGFVKTNDKKGMLIDLAKAIGLTLLLTANVWGGLLLVLKTNNISPTLTHQLASNALTIGKRGTVRNSILRLTLAILIAQIIYAILTWEKSRTNLVVTVEGGIFLLLSSKLIPWKNIQDSASFLENYLQFPHRLLTIAYPLILLGMAISVSEFKNKKVIKNVAYCVIGFVILENFATNSATLWQRTTFNHRAVYEVESKKYYTTKNMYNQERYYKFLEGLHGKYQANGIRNTNYGNIYVKVTTRGDYYKNTLDTGKVWRLTHYTSQRGKLFETIIKVNPDYLPTYHKKLLASRVDYYYINNVIKPYLAKKFTHQVLPNGKLQLTWNSKKAKIITLPIIMYKQSQLTLNKKVVSPKLGYIGTPIVKSRKGKNIAVLQFIVPIWFRMLFIVTIISWLLLLGYGIKRILKLKE